MSDLPPVSVHPPVQGLTARLRKKLFEGEAVGACLTVTPCWYYRPAEVSQ